MRIAVPTPRCWSGDGAVSRVLEVAGHEVLSTDLVDRGYGEVQDFLTDHHTIVDHVVTNPPYGPPSGLAARFVAHALTRIRPGGTVCMLLPLNWAAAQRHRTLMAKCARKWLFSRRLPMHRGGWTGNPTLGETLAPDAAQCPRHSAERQFKIEAAVLGPPVVRLVSLGHQGHHCCVVGHETGTQRQDRVLDHVDQVTRNPPTQKRAHLSLAAGDLRPDAHRLATACGNAVLRVGEWQRCCLARGEARCGRVHGAVDADRVGCPQHRDFDIAGRRALRVPGRGWPGDGWPHSTHC
jgi:hypothetical protein